MIRLSVLCALALVATAHASERLTGDVLDIAYNDNGTWNEATSEVGLMYWSGTAWVEFTYPGSPYQRWSAEWTEGGSGYLHYADSDGYDTTATAVTEADASTSTDLIAVHTYQMDSLFIEKTESWDVADSVVLVEFVVTNTGTADVTDFRVMYEFDPDQEYTDHGLFETYNDTVDADGDGTADWSSSEGVNDGLTVGIGACEPEASALGHYEDWGDDPDADTSIGDEDGQEDDFAVALRYTEPRTIAAGATIVTSLLVVVDASSADAQSAYLANLPLCVGCDTDGDGHDSSTCGGADCDDMDATTYPGASDAWYDGVDSNCDGASDYDQDADGFDDSATGGDDCNDLDGAVNPGATEVWYDGVDQDCDGASDYDQDGDGADDVAYGGDDCNDLDATVNRSATEVWYDGVDQDCDGASDYDQDGDGTDSTAVGGSDCNDLDAAISEAAEETWYDGVDSDCGGDSDFDQDRDGHDDAAHGGDDCNDVDFAVHPDATETWYDGVDSDCAGDDDHDQDGDGVPAASGGGDDCDDTDAGAYPGATDTWYDGVDSDCAGNDDHDQDGDGDAAASGGGNDCDDTDPAVSSTATEVWYDGVDTDCDGADDNDQDGDGVALAADCDDTDATVSAAADCDSGTGDTGDTADTGDSVLAGGCGCASTPTGGLAAGVLAAGALLTWRRRRG